MTVKIIGAGFSGLTLAYYLQKKGLQVEIHEASSKPGGLIQSEQREKFLIEGAANGFIASEKIVQLFQALDIKILTTNKESKKRFIYHKDSLSRWPLSFLQTLRFILGILKTIALKKIATPKNYETIKSWSDRNFGKAFTKQLLSPALSGIYAGEISKMSATLVFGKFFNKNQRLKKSKEYKGTITPDKGMSQFILALTNEITKNGGQIYYNSPKRPEELDGIKVIATSLDKAKNLDPQIPKDLETLDICSTTLYFKEDSPQEGFGVLFPKEENIQALGVLLNKNIFSNRCQTGHSQTWILGKKHFNETNKDSDILNILTKNIQTVFNVTLNTNDYKIHPYKNALPHYTLELEKFLNNYRPDSQLYHTGNYMGMIGLSGILEFNYNLAQKIAGETNEI